MGVFLSTSEGFFCAQEWFIIPCRNQKGNENMRICTFSTKVMSLAWFYFRFTRCFRQISFLGSSSSRKGKEERGHCERGWFSKPLFKFGSFACWKARLTRTGSFQGTSTFLACSAGVLLGRVNAKKLAIVHSTNQFSPMKKSKIAAIIFTKIILSTCPPKLRQLYRLVLSSPKPQLWDDYLVK